MRVLALTADGGRGLVRALADGQLTLPYILRENSW